MPDPTEEEGARYTERRWQIISGMYGGPVILLMLLVAESVQATNDQQILPARILLIIVALIAITTGIAWGADHQARTMHEAKKYLRSQVEAAAKARLHQIVNGATGATSLDVGPHLRPVENR